MNDQIRIPNGDTGLGIRHRFGSRVSDFGFCLLLFAITITIYWPVRQFSWVNFDDPEYVYASPHILAGLKWSTFSWAFTTVQGANWAPLTLLSFLLDVRLFGASPSPMHVENMLMHAISACTWYVLLVRMTARPGRCFVVAALFAVPHPAHVESVAWITERKDVLSMLLMVLSLLLYYQYTRKHSPPAYILSLLLYALALMAKAMMVTQPFLMLLIDLWPLRRANILNPISIQWRNLLLEKIPFFALAIAASVITAKVQSGVGATRLLPNLSPGDHIANVTLGYIRYVGIALYPHNLSVFYPFQHNQPAGAVFAAVILLLLITALTVRAWPRRPYLLIGWLWFVGTMVPVIGLVQVGLQSIADRYTYLPFMGLFMAVVWLVADLFGPGKSARRITAIISIATLLACAVTTSRLLPCWKNTVTLFSNAEANVEPDWNIEEHLAAGYTDAGRPDLAVDHYEESLQLKNDNYSAHACLAALLLRVSPADALPHYKIAAELSPLNAVAHYNYAVCLTALKQNAQAAAEFQRALQLNPQLKTNSELQH